MVIVNFGLALDIHSTVQSELSFGQDGQWTETEWCGFFFFFFKKRDVIQILYFIFYIQPNTVKPCTIQHVTHNQWHSTLLFHSRRNLCGSSFSIWVHHQTQEVRFHRSHKEGALQHCCGPVMADTSHKWTWICIFKQSAIQHYDGSMTICITWHQATNMCRE